MLTSTTTRELRYLMPKIVYAVVDAAELGLPVVPFLLEPATQAVRKSGQLYQLICSSLCMVVLALRGDNQRNARPFDKIVIDVP